MAVYYIRNRRGEHRHENWKEFWEKHTDQTADICHVVGCGEDAEDGAHVNRIDVKDDNKVYIVPMCHKCNCQFGQEFYVVGPLVSVDGETVLP